MPLYKRFLVALGLIGILFFPGDRFFLGWESASAQVPVGRIIEYNVSFTAAATAAAIGTSQQTVTVTGLATTDVVYVNGPVPTALCPYTGFRVSAANTLQIDFTTLTAAACTPAAGTYNIIAIR